ncbi:Metabotropic glutamate receptor 3 [Paragonimus heterotremus]|uniref:Metabotropic glutamate receptor 3 n=1 Tax=Paragonimus heterotremus TaxID=100268 RepID=A0A8J4STN0_9TREM|nr:Metabotropic glutamate receptor 3 [Paragonimus heterotremus]
MRRAINPIVSFKSGSALRQRSDRGLEYYIICFSVFAVATLCSSVKNTNEQLVAETPGDIILGGLFPVHTSGTSMCNAINPERGVQRVEAMLFTIDEINNNSKLLPGLQMGAIIRDTCSATNYVLEQALQFVQGGGTCGASKERPITRGVVGSSYSSVSILVAQLFRLFALPQISYASTSAVLSDKRSFPLFARTVPSDVVQARAMASLVAAHNWTYVSTVRSAGDYGDSGMDAFWKEADKLGVCIAAREVIRSNSGVKELDAIVRVLSHDFAKARVIVLFTGMDHTKLLLDAVRRAGLVNHFVWIASDGWGRENVPVTNNSRVANGALTIEIKAKPVAAFTEHYLNLHYNNPRNPWFREYWEELFDCTFDDGRFRIKRNANLSRPKRHVSPVKRKPCQRDPKLRLQDRLGTDFKQEAKIQFVYHAVYAFAHSLHNLQEKLCSGNPYKPGWDKKGCIEKLLSFSGTEFYKNIINTSYTGRHIDEIDYFIRLQVYYLSC